MVNRKLTDLEKLSLVATALRYDSTVELLRDLEVDATLAAMRCERVEQSIDHSLAAIRRMAPLATRDMRNPSLQSHFDYVFQVLSHHLEARRGQSYNSLLGLPENGNPLTGMRSNEEVDHLLLGVARHRYRPSREVEAWFAARQNLLFHRRFPRSNGDLEKYLREHFGQR